MTSLATVIGEGAGGLEPARPLSELGATVTLSRQDRTDIGQRQIYVRLDAGSTHTMIFGQRITLDVVPGAHVIYANNTLFWKRVPFSIEPGEHIEFALINRAGKLGLGFLSLVGVGPLNLVIERR